MAALVPQTTPVTPNAVFASNVMLGMSIQNGAPVGMINDITLTGAVVDPTTGAWTPTSATGSLRGIRFAFDAGGNITGLPADLASLAPDILIVWQDLVKVVGEINAIRKLV